MPDAVPPDPSQTEGVVKQPERRTTALPPTGSSSVGTHTADPAPAEEAVDLSPFRRRRILLLLVVGAALKTALLVQQLSMWAAMALLGCPKADVTVGFGPNGGHAVGVGSCSSGAAFAAGAVACLAPLTVSAVLLLLFRRGIHPRNRVVSAYLYLVAVAALAELLATMVVFGILGKMEAAVLIEHGVPWWGLVLGGLVAGGLLVFPVWKTTPYFATELLGHEQNHVHIFQKAIWFKLTVGVGIMAAVRLFA